MGGGGSGLRSQVQVGGVPVSDPWGGSQVQVGGIWSQIWGGGVPSPDAGRGRGVPVSDPGGGGVPSLSKGKNFCAPDLA